MLTKKQHELLLYIHGHLGDHGVSPSFDEMKDALGLKSKSGIHRLITGLVERGFIRRLPHRARAVEVLRLPEDMPKAAGTTGGRFAPRVIEGDFGGSLHGATVASEVESVQLPLYGKIAAGTPIEAIETPEAIDVPKQFVGSKEAFALRVRGRGARASSPR